MIGPPGATTTRQRRTQDERRRATRGQILRATIDCLVEAGYSGTTTLGIERRAGVSRGARIHHFPSKAALLASAVDHLYSGLAETYAAAFGGDVEGRTDQERFRDGLRLLWSVFRSRDYTAALELNMAARTEPELAERLAQVGDRHRELALAAAGQYFPALPDAVAGAVVETLHVAMMGLLMQQNVNHDEDVEQQVLSQLDYLVSRHLQE